MINRTEVARCLAKAIALKACDRHEEANLWAARLIGLLECADIIDPSRIGLQDAARGMVQL